MAVCWFAISSCVRPYVIPTYFLALPNSVREETFGIISLCNVYEFGSLLVFSRSSDRLSFALSGFLVSAGITLLTCLFL